MNSDTRKKAESIAPIARFIGLDGYSVIQLSSKCASSFNLGYSSSNAKLSNLSVRQLSDYRLYGGFYIPFWCNLPVSSRHAYFDS